MTTNDSGAAFRGIKDHSLRTTPFQKNCYGSFGFVSTLRKKVFSGEPVKCFLLYGSNNTYSVAFGNATFGEIKDHSLKTTPIQNKSFAMEVLGMCLPYVERYF